MLKGWKRKGAPAQGAGVSPLGRGDGADGPPPTAGAQGPTAGNGGAVTREQL